MLPGEVEVEVEVEVGVEVAVVDDKTGHKALTSTLSLDSQMSSTMTTSKMMKGKDTRVRRTHCRRHETTISNNSADIDRSWKAQRQVASP